jgi:two-component system, sensor histidine kinase and response regulator
MDDDIPNAARPGPADPAREAEIAFDRAALLDRVGGDESIFVEVVRVFLEDAPGQVQSMDAALGDGDMTTLRRLAHTMKGAAGTVGAVALQGASLALEQAIDRGDLSVVRELILPVRAHYAAAERTMRTWVPEERT